MDPSLREEREREMENKEETAGKGYDPCPMRYMN